MAGKKLLVYPWRVEKEHLVEPALLIYGADDKIAGSGVVSATNHIDGSHEGLNRQTFDTNHDIDQNGQLVVKQYKKGHYRRRDEIKKFFEKEEKKEEEEAPKAEE